MSEDNNTNTNEGNGPDIYNESEDADDGEQDPAPSEHLSTRKIFPGEKKILGKPYESMVHNLILIAAANQIILTDPARQHKRDAMAKVFDIVFDPINGIGSSFVIPWKDEFKHRKLAYLIKSVVQHIGEAAEEKELGGMWYFLVVTNANKLSQ
jgi:hypothetical protein